MEYLAETIDKLFAENRGAEAEKLMEQALQDAYATKDWTAAIPILNELIGYCRETSQVERSYGYAEEVQDILQQIGLTGTLPHATTLLNIANAYRAGGRLEDSLQKYEEVAEVYRDALEPEDMLWASFYNNLSLLYQEMRRFELAKESLLKALQIVVQKKDTIFEQAVTYTNLANTCLQLGQGEEAEKYFTGAILLFERYDIKDAHYCAALSALATYLYQKQEYEKAEGYFLKAMEGIEKSLGRNEFYARMQENARICGDLARRQEDVQSGRVYAEKPGDVQSGEAGTHKSENSYDCKEGERHSDAGADVDKAAFVSGLALCREYYEEVCKPMLEQEFPEYVDQIAVGLVGEGSDCFGFDDAFSRDHDWGPSLLLWVTDQVYAEIGEALERAYAALPKEYKGFVYQETVQAARRRGVWKIGEFFQNILGAENFRLFVPQSGENGGWQEGNRTTTVAESGSDFTKVELSGSLLNSVAESGSSLVKDGKNGAKWGEIAVQWEHIADDRLAAATNGEVFVDKSGEFTQIREFLRNKCPKRIQYLKIAEAAARFSQCGQYNYVRMQKRGDRVTAGLMLAEAVKEAMKLLYYVNGEYPPHDKWLWKGLQEKEGIEAALELFETLMLGDIVQGEALDREPCVAEEVNEAKLAWQSKRSNGFGESAVLLEKLGEQLAFLLYRADYISDVDSFLQEHVQELLYKASVADLSIEELAEKIARTEFEAFDKVKNQGGRADCQDDWFTFSIMRKSQYLTWNREMLLQYLYDFTREYSRGHNLIEEKYGRMMESTAPAEYEKLKAHFPSITPEKKQIIEEIVRLQVGWMENFSKEYPKLAGNARSIHTYEDHIFNTSYETYLRGEISTYSDKMLELYGRYIVAYVNAQKNLARDIMEHSVLMYGYEDLQDAETRLEG